MEVLAVIPARGGSKSVPRKNLRTVGGVSLVERAVVGAQQSTLISRIVASTDDREIAAEFERVGVEVPWLRPAGLAADDSPDSPVFLHALEQLASAGYEPDLVLNLRPTAPLRRPETIDRTIRALIELPEADSAKTVSPASHHPHKMWWLAENVLMPVLPDLHHRFGDPDVARQRLPPAYESNGVVDAVRVAELTKTRSFHPGAIAGVIIDRWEALDVDTEEDIAIAEYRLNTR